MVGFNSRLDGLQAAVLRVKLPHLEHWNARRRSLASLYRRALANVPGLTVPEPAAEREAVYHLFVIRSVDRDGLQAQLQAAEIATAIHYPIPLHLQPAFASLGYRRGDFPVAETCSDEVLALPIYPEMSEEAAAHVCGTIRQWAARRG